MEESKQQSGLGSKLKLTRTKFISSYYRSSVKDLKIIAITGAEGRSTTANYLKNILYVQDNYIGLVLDPKSIKDMYRQLSDIWKSGAKHAIITITNQGLLDHFFYQLPVFLTVNLDYGKTLPITATSDTTSVAREILYNTNPNFNIVSHDHPDFDLLASYPTKSATFSYGQSRGSDLRISRFKLYKKGTEANLAYGTDNFDVATYEIGEPSIHYMAAAALAGLTLGANFEEITDGIADYEPNTTPTSTTQY